MKRYLPVVVVVLIAVGFFVAGIVSRPVLGRARERLALRLAPRIDPIDVLHWTQKAGEYADLHHTRKLVFLGDSRVEFGNWSELFDRCDISNRGIGWDTTNGILRRLSSSIPNQVELCVIQAGINDLLQNCSADHVVSNFTQILQDLSTRTHSKVIVTSIILADQDRSRLNGIITLCNQRLSSKCAELGVVYVNINTMLCPNGFLSPDFSYDGIHLNWEGYKQLRSILGKYLPR